MRWLRNLPFFRRRDPSQGPVPAEDWQPGDLAECLHAGPWFRSGIIPNLNGPALGEIRMVKRVRIAIDPGTGLQSLFLRFSVHQNAWYVAHCFRKITPRAEEITRAEPEFIELIRRAPAPAPVPAPVPEDA